MSLTLDKKPNSEQIATLYPYGDPIYMLTNNTEVDFQTGAVTKKEKGRSKIQIVPDAKTKAYYFPYIHDSKLDGQTERIYITAKSGAGKTFKFIRPYCIQYHKQFPSNKIFLFSSKLKDRALDDLKFVKRIVVDEDILTNPFEIDLFENSLCVFDDIEDFPLDPKGKPLIGKAVLKLLEELLRNSRSYNTYLLYTHHTPTNYKETKLMLHEATAVVIFPRSKYSGKADYDYLMKQYVPINKDLQTIIKNTNSEYVYITKTNPLIIISNNYILSE